jgi:hypothetical protein
MLDVASRGSACPPDYAVEQADKYVAAQARLADLLMDGGVDAVVAKFAEQLDGAMAETLARTRVVGEVYNQGAPIPGFAVRGHLDSPVEDRDVGWDARRHAFLAGKSNLGPDELTRWIVELGPALIDVPRDVRFVVRTVRVDPAGESDDNVGRAAGQ